MEVEKNEFNYCEKPEAHVVDTDILLIGGGMACSCSLRRRQGAP